MIIDRIDLSGNLTMKLGRIELVEIREDCVIVAAYDAQDRPTLPSGKIHLAVGESVSMMGQVTIS